MGLFFLVFTTLIATALNGAKEISYDRNVRPILSDRCFHCHGPELTDFSRENKTLIESYGPEVHKPVFFASNCLLAKRMAERDVHFIQLFHRVWDHHGALPQNLRGQCQDVDQPISALLKDLRQRGLLEDTLVVFAGEFGR
ncbi:MAG: DUF1501 domain-containing protein, partial [Opitutales bacterium]|nr:DUF1501 domain-containing protein [Opitutales bacterium]